MKRVTLAVLTALIGLGLASSVLAEKKEAPANPAFEQIKALAGTWTGKGTMEGKEQTIQTKFRITSGGTAVEEVLFPGTPHEMVDMYYPEGDGVSMVHYCAMGNQPRLKLNSKGKKLDFVYVDGSNIPSSDSPHMSGLSLTIKGKDKLVEDWSSSPASEAKKMDSFVFTRVE